MNEDMTFELFEYKCDKNVYIRLSLTVNWFLKYNIYKLYYTYR